MCGRYTISETVSKLKASFCFKNSLNLQPRFNLAPGQAAPIITENDKGSRHLSMMDWGFLSENYKTKSGATKRIINARSETLLEKKSFKDVAVSQRCLILADGFYEWKRDGGGKKAYYIYANDHKSFAFAGLWRSEANNTHLGFDSKSFVILTRAAVTSIKRIHHRMPFILNVEHCEAWLNGTVATATNLLNENHHIELSCHEVSDRVGNVRNDDPSLCDKFIQPQLALF